ncbi:MAG TPA: hypothetical protein VNW04_06550 [Puia sp.]|jgi:hypothetical protein|nr:hypothetical protein [Puia sp.]
MTGFATKDELAQIKHALNTGFSDIRLEMASLKGDLELKISDVKGGLEVKIAEVKSDVIRWMFTFFVAMLLAILGLYFKK